MMMTPTLYKQKSAPNLMMMTPSASTTGGVSPNTAAKLQLAEMQIKAAQLNKEAEESKERQQAKAMLEGLDQSNK